MEKKTGGLPGQSYHKKALFFGAGALVIAMALLTWINTKITVYSDDYWYGTFFDGGFVAFLKEMYRHYRETNGRLYVHLIIPTVLLFDTKLFIVLSPLLLAALYGVGAKVLNEKISLPVLLAQAAFGILCTLACDVMYLRMTIFWISAYFNYVFPVLMTSLAVLFQRRWYREEQGKTEHVFGLIFAVLAGAATEQCALVSLVIVWGYAALNWLFGGLKFKRCWSYPLFVLLGFLTILCAPGSWARVDRGVEGGILSCLIPSVFVERFYDAMIFVVKYPSTIVLLALTDVLAGVLCLRDKSLPKGLLLGFVFAAAQIAAFCLGHRWAGCILYAVSVLYLAVVFLLRRDYWLTGLFLLGSLTSNMMLIITTLGFERTSMVGLVTQILVAVSLLFRVTRKLPKWTAIVCLALVAAVCIGAFVPTLRGYTASKKIVDENLASIEESKTTGEALFSIDIDPRYRFTMPFEGNYFYENFRKYYGMAEDTKLTFTSDRWNLADLKNADGSRCVFPTLEDENGLLVPFEQAMAAAGGKAVFSWRDHSYDVTLGDSHWHITAEGEVSKLEDTGKYARQEGEFSAILPFSETYTLIYAPVDQLTAFFGLTWDYDQAKNLYTVTAP